MLQTFRPTPTCTRFQTSIEMPCMKCGAQMRLATIEPRDQNYDVLTYRCTPCDSGESFLKVGRMDQLSGMLERRFHILFGKR